MRQVSGASEKLGKAGDRFGKGLNTGWKDWQKVASQDMDQLVDVSVGAMDRFWLLQQSALAKLQTAWKRTIEANNIGDQLGGAIGRMAGRVSQVGGVSGILGFLLWGQMEQAEWNARAQQSAQVIEGLEPMSKRFLSTVGAQVRSLVVNGQASIEDLRATIGAAAEFGFGQTQLLAGGFHGVNRSAMTATVAMDKLFEVGAGTTAKAAAELAATTNSTFADGVKFVEELGRSARETGMHFNSMLGTIMQITSALRLQMNTTEDLKDANKALVQTMAGFQAQGMGAPRAAQLATMGMQGIAGALQGIGPGLKAVIGERIGGAQGLGAIRQFEQGFRGDDVGFFRRTMTEVAGMSREIAGGDDDTQYQVLKQLFGMSPEAAEAMISMQRAMDRGEMTDKEATGYLEELKNALSKEGLKESTFDKMMRQLMNALANIAAGLVKILVSGFQSLILLGRAAVAKMLGADNDAIRDAMASSFEPIAKGFESGWSQVVRGAGQAAGVSKNFAEAFGFRPMQDDALDKLISGQRVKKQKEDAEAEKRGQGSEKELRTLDKFGAINIPASQLMKGSRIEVRIFNDFVEEAVS